MESSSDLSLVYNPNKLPILAILTTKYIDEKAQLTQNKDISVPELTFSSTKQTVKGERTIARYLAKKFHAKGLSAVGPNTVTPYDVSRFLRYFFFGIRLILGSILLWRFPSISKKQQLK